MADPIVFNPYLDWVDVPEGDNIPPNAKLVSAADLMRYEQFGVAAAARLNEHDAKWDDYATDETFIRNSLTTNANQITGVQNLITGKSIGSTDNLNSFTSTGTFIVGSTMTGRLAFNFPKDTDSGILHVYARVAGNTVVQQWHSFSSAVTGKGFYQRSLNGTTWSPWRFHGGIRMDTTSGIAAYIWDDVNAREQVIYRSTDRRIHVGTTAPTDTTMIWVDIS
jgi:hypothetical protein